MKTITSTSEIRDELIKYVNEYPELGGADLADKFIKEHKKEFKIALKLDTIRREISYLQRCSGIEPKIRITAEKSVTELLEDSRDKGRIKVLHNQNKNLITELQNAQKTVNFLLGIKDHKVETLGIKEDKSRNNGKSEATAMAVASDWHVEEKVTKKSVNGLNEYNPDIAIRRGKKFFENFIKIIRKERQDIQIRKAVLALLGDFMSGHIHDELVEDNYMSPSEAILFLVDMFTNGIKYILNDQELEELIIPCSIGNHSRTTIKMRVSTSFKHSYEWLLYHNLKQKFSDDSRVKFQIADQYFNYVKVYDKLLRMHHGNNIRYCGGIGGLSVPLIKYIQKSNAQIKADLDVLGHFHTSIFDENSKYMVNGSLIGYNAFGVKIGAGYEKPKQRFQLIDSKRGFTVATPILVED